MGNDFEDATDRVTGRTRFVDAGDHRGLGRRIRAAQRGRIGLLTRPDAVRRVDADPADFGAEGPDLDAQFAQKGAGDGTGGHSRRGLPGRRALKHVPNVVEAVLQGTGEVGVARPDPGDRHRSLVALAGGVVECGRRRVIEGLHGHHLGPVLPVAVAHQEQDRRAEGRAVSDATQDLGPVLLDRLAGATAVALLAPDQVERDFVGRELQAGRNTLDRHPQGRAVRFAGGQEAECGHRSRRRCAVVSAAGQSTTVAVAGSLTSPLTGSPSAERSPPARASASFACMSSRGAACPVHRVKAAAP